MKTNLDIQRMRSGSSYAYTFDCPMCEVIIHPNAYLDYVKSRVRQHGIIDHSIRAEFLNVQVVNPPQCQDVLQFGLMSLGCSMGEHLGDHEKLYEDVGVNGKSLPPGQKVKVRWSVVE